MRKESGFLFWKHFTDMKLIKLKCYCYLRFCVLVQFEKLTLTRMMIKLLVSWGTHRYIQDLIVLNFGICTNIATLNIFNIYIGSIVYWNQHASRSI